MSVALYSSFRVEITDDRETTMAFQNWVLDRMRSDHEFGPLTGGATGGDFYIKDFPINCYDDVHTWFSDRGIVS